ncbi:MAG: hypothetical protein IV097_05970 [Burkholderiaceae bacterium]|nr:hypothetical protein [Burkholderiaceae bacterium]
MSRKQSPLPAVEAVESVPPGARTMAEICAGPTAPGGMDAEQRAELLGRLKDASEAMASVLKRGEAVRAALMALFPADPGDLAAVLLAPSQSTRDPAWVSKVKQTQKLTHAKVLIDDVLDGVFTSLEEWPYDILKDAIASLEGTG